MTTLADVKILLERGVERISFAVEYKNGKAVPMGAAERALIDQGVLWFQTKDYEKRTYTIIKDARALVEAEDDA